MICLVLVDVYALKRCSTKSETGISGPKCLKTSSLTVPSVKRVNGGRRPTVPRITYGIYTVSPPFQRAAVDLIEDTRLSKGCKLALSAMEHLTR